MKCQSAWCPPSTRENAQGSGRVSKLHLEDHEGDLSVRPGHAVEELGALASSYAGRSRWTGSSLWPRKSGFIVAFGGLASDEGAHHKAWQDAGLLRLHVCVNVPPRQLREKTWIGRVAHALAESGPQARYLVVELTELVDTHDVEQGRRDDDWTGQVRVCKLLFDGSGTGSLQVGSAPRTSCCWLRSIESFVQFLASDPDDWGIASAGHSMEVTCGSLPRALKPRSSWAFLA